MKNTPKSIFLQIGEDVDTADWNEIHPECVSWCAERINENDLEYVLAFELKGNSAKLADPKQQGKLTAKEWLFKQYPKVKDEWGKTGHDDEFMARMMDEFAQYALSFQPSGNAEQLVCDCGNKLTDKEIYFGQCLQCDKNIEEAN